MRSMGFGILVAAALAMPASAESILIDDFNDGNDDGWDHLDFIAGQPFGPAPGMTARTAWSFALCVETKETSGTSYSRSTSERRTASLQQDGMPDQRFDITNDTPL